MLIWLAEGSDWFGPLRLFDSITFRAVAAVALAFVFMLVLAPRFIRHMRRIGGLEDVDKPDSATLNNLHANKKGTPAMGGLVLVAATFLAALLACDPANPLVWVGQGILLAFGALGFVDDYMKLKGLGKRGLSKRQKLAAQSALALVTVGVLAWGAADGWFRIADIDTAPDATVNVFAPNGENGVDETVPRMGQAPTRLVVPLTKWSEFRPQLGWFYWLLAAFIIVACSNAVNLTDGLDGLAAGCSLMVVGTYAALSYIVGNVVMCAFFRIPHVPGCGELAIFGMALCGGLMGFLWFNAHPAKMFMGDTGSLALGAAVAFLAIATKHELVLIIAGGVFVIEAASVLLQMIYYKATGGRRLFRCAPFHHHLEFGGWHENHIVVRLWIVGAILSAVALATLKLH